MKGGFRLGVVLRLREMAEDTARIQLGRSLRAHRDALEAARRLESEAAAEIERARELQLQSGARGGTPALELQAATESTATAERSMTTAGERVAAAAHGLLEARRLLAEASRRRQVVERLRDRVLAAEALRLQRIEEATLGEIASTRHAWRAIEERTP